MSKIERGSRLRKFYRSLTVILCFFWAILAFGGVSRCFSRAYVYPIKYREQVFKVADSFGFQRGLILAVIKVESGFNEKAVSRVGAEGLMQLTPATAEYVAEILGVENYDMLTAEDNLQFGCFYLKYLCDKFENLETALAAYNAGEGNVILWLKNPDFSDDNVTLKNIPFAETKAYVRKIYETFKNYNKLYGYILDKRV